MEIELTRAAIALADLGFKVIRLTNYSPNHLLKNAAEIEAADKETKKPTDPAYQLRPGATEEEILSWSGLHNYGIHCGAALTLIDGDTAESVRWIEENLPPTPLRIKTRRGAHFWYRSTEIQHGAKARSEDGTIKIDIIVNGYGLGPGCYRIDSNGRPYVAYTLEGGAGLDYGPEDLPELRSSDLIELEALAGFVIGSEPFELFELGAGHNMRAIAKPQRIPHDWCFFTPAGEGNQGAQDVLFYAVKCDQLSREQAAERLRLWNDLREANGAPRHTESAFKLRYFFEYKWADFVNGADYGRLGSRRSEKESTLTGLERDIIRELGSGAEEHEEPEEIKEESTEPAFPLECRTVPGSLGLYVDHYMKSALVPHRDMAVFSAISLGSVVASRRYRTPRNVYSSLYQVVIAGTGVGKEYAQGLVSDILEAAGCEHLEGGGGFHSTGSILSELKESPNSWAAMDEFGDILKGQSDKRNTQAKQVWGALRSIWSKADKKWQPAAYSREGQAGKLVEKRAPVRNPGLSIFGATTQRQFMSAVSSDELENGLLNRFLFCVNEASRKEVPVPESEEIDGESLEDELDEIPEELIRWVETAASLEAHEIDSAAALEGMSAAYLEETAGERWKHKPKNQIVIRYTKEARRWINAAPTLDGDNPMFARVSENSRRVMVILAVSIDPDNPRITLEVARWSVRYVQYLAQVFNKSFAENLAESKYQEQFNFVRDKIKRFKGKGVSPSKLEERLTALSRRDRTEILRDLLAQRVILFGRPAGAHPNVQRLFHRDAVDQAGFVSVLSSF